MGSSIFLAQILGPIIAVVGVSLIFNEKFFKKIMKEVSEQTNIMLYISGLISMFLGLYILLTVENQGQLYQSILIIFGFIATLKGVLLLIFPKYMKKSAKSYGFLANYFQYFGFAYIVLGAYLCYVGY